MELMAIPLIAGLGWLQYRAIASWQGIWRLLAAAPLAIAAADALWVIAQTSYDPTSHNLWPLEMLFVWVCGLPVVGVLWLARIAIKA